MDGNKDEGYSGNGINVESFNYMGRDGCSKGSIYSVTVGANGEGFGYTFVVKGETVGRITKLSDGSPPRSCEEIRQAIETAFEEFMMAKAEKARQSLDSLQCLR